MKLMKKQKWINGWLNGHSSTITRWFSSPFSFPLWRLGFLTLCIHAKKKIGKKKV